MYSVTSDFLTVSKSIVSDAKCTLTAGGIAVGGVTDISIQGSLGDAGSFGVGSFVSQSLNFTCLSTGLPTVTMSTPIVPSLGYVVGDSVELVPMGEFYTSPKFVSHKNLLSVVQAFDRAWTLTDTYASNLTFPTTAQAVMSEIAAWQNITVTQNAAYARLAGTTVYEAPEGTIRDVIAGLALLIGCNVQFGRTGELEFIAVNIDGSSVISYTGAHYKNESYTLTSNEPVIYGQVTCEYSHEETVGDETEEVTESWTYEAAVGSRGVLISTSDIRSQAATDQLGQYIVGASGVDYYGYSVTLFGQPQLDLGDRVTVLDPNGENYEFMILSIAHNYTGAMSTTISAAIADDEVTAVDGGNPSGSLSYAVSNAQASADNAAVSAKNAQASADAAQSSADAAQTAAEEAQSSADAAQADATRANTAANNALTGLSTVESVVDTLTWLTEHSTPTADTTAVEGKNYYIRNADGTFTRVSNTEGKNPASEGWYEMDEAVANYVASHLALTDYGLNLTLDNTSYRIHIGTLTSTGEDGVYIIDGNGNVVSYFGENIRFSDGKAQYIGNQNAYIIFNPANGGSITIGGSNIILGSNQTLDELLDSVDNTLIYDHTYEYERDNQNKPIAANFTAFLYRGGVDVKTSFDPSEFTWALKYEDKTTGNVVEVQKGSGYTCRILLSECGFGAEVIGKFSPANDANALDVNRAQLLTADSDPISVRASGDSVRVRDLSVSTTLYPADRIMIVGAEDEHLVTMQTLQNYLNANLDKQILFGTTAEWNAQSQLQSEAGKVYVYTDHRIDSQGNRIAGIKMGDGNAYLIDLPFQDEAIYEHIEDSTIHITAAERAFWNDKVRCYYSSGDNLIFTTN